MMQPVTDLFEIIVSILVIGLLVFILAIVFIRSYMANYGYTLKERRITSYEWASALMAFVTVGGFLLMFANL